MSYQPYKRVVIRSYRLAVIEFLVVFILGLSVGLLFDFLAKIITFIHP